MSEAVQPEMQLVAGRNCGTCNVCCVALTINEPPLLQKVPGIRCKNLQPDHLCAIYDTRPDTCRSFFCGFRYLRWVKDTLRPDVSDVLVRMQQEQPGSPYASEIGVVFMLLSPAALKAVGLLESIAAGVMGDVAVYLSIPGPPGQTASIALVNDVLRHVVITRDRPGMLKLLRQAYAAGRSGKREAVTFKRITGGPGAGQLA